MNLVDKFITGAGLLILVYLVVSSQNQGGVQNIFRGLTEFTRQTVTVLQGR